MSKDAKEIADAFNDIVKTVAQTEKECGSRNPLTRSQKKFVLDSYKILTKK